MFLISILSTLFKYTLISLDDMQEAVLTLDAPLLYFLVELLHYSAPARTPGSTLRSFCLADSDAVVGKTDLHNALGLQ